jgi:TPP-dependent pyruvate/acetoin dehydrogenase alpha subunit
MNTQGPLTLAQLDELDLKNSGLMDAAVEFARNSPLPTPDELYRHVFPADPTGATR